MIDPEDTYAATARSLVDKAALCHTMGWTEQEYNSQRTEFINTLWTYIEWKQKKQSK